MPFDPSKPANGTKLSSAEMRGQLTGLKEEVDDKVSNQDLIANSSANSNQVQFLGFTVSDPPTQSEMQAVVDKVDELIQQLRR